MTATTVPPRGWQHCANNDDIHYFAPGAAAPLCGRALAPAGPFRCSVGRQGDKSTGNALDRCPECERAHLALWAKGGAL